MIKNGRPYTNENGYVDADLITDHHSEEEIKSLDSTKSLMRYDSLFQEELFGNTTAYPVQVYGFSTTLVQLLGSNPDERKMYLHCHRKETKECLQQAFATAGSKFDPIGRGNMTEVIVPHDKTAKILLKKLPSFGVERRRILNKLQEYIVRIPDYQMEKFRELTKNRKGIDIIEETSYNTDTGIG